MTVTEAWASAWDAGWLATRAAVGENAGEPEWAEAWEAVGKHAMASAWEETRRRNPEIMRHSKPYKLVNPHWDK